MINTCVKMQRPFHRHILHLLCKPIVLNVSLLYLVTFLIVLPISCRNMKNSLYFSTWTDQEDGKIQLKHENLERFESAKRYIEGLKPNDMHDMWHKKDAGENRPQVTISIITHSRTRHIKDGYSPGYLTQSVSKFIELVRAADGFHADFFICNVDSDPDYHKEAKDLGNLVPIVNRFSRLTLPMVHPKEKEKQDYMFCLNRSLDFQAPFIFLVEDDALPHNDTLTVLRHVLRSHIISDEHSTSDDHGTRSNMRTAYIKFYHPERLLGFLSGSYERIPELLSLAAVLSTISLLLCTKITRKFPTNQLYVVWAILYLYYILVQLCIGRTNIVQMRSVLSPHLYSLTPAPSCCTQALLYPRYTATKLVSFMDTKNCGNDYAKDHIIEEFAKHERLNAFLVQPNVFSHIGLYSALRNQIVDPFLL